ncbi:hypothetical protein [Pseudalkalibacillus sp. JSM 102089]|uniref:hypothetical protein n=1 Tax=Pseudalkalibacillus sp. JSM 102089 TaxID=3229856 RepID=UPI0035262D96
MDTTLKTSDIDVNNIYKQVELATRNIGLITKEFAKRMSKLGECLSLIMKSVYEKLAELNAIMVAQLAYDINKYALDNSIEVNENGYLSNETKNVTRTKRLRDYCKDFFGQVFKAYPRVKPIVKRSFACLNLGAALITYYGFMSPDPKPVINNYYQIDEIHYNINKNDRENSNFPEDKELSGGIKI